MMIWSKTIKISALFVKLALIMAKKREKKLCG